MINTIEGVLPITKKDFERFSLLQITLDRFFPDLRPCHVVVPDKEYSFFRDAIQSNRFQLLTDSEVVPEFLHFPSTSGWYKQQLIKLAIHEHIKTDYYVTLDADVICVKPTTTADLIRNGRAMSRRTEKDYHPEWYTWAERVLGGKRSGFTHGVTPSIFSVQVLNKFAEYLANKRFGVRDRTKLVLRSLKEKALIRPGWRAYLLLNIPWTEYSLYNTFAEQNSLFEKYHFDGGKFSIYHNSVWTVDQFNSWNPKDSFYNNEEFYFCVIQSTANVSLEQIREKVSPYIDLDVAGHQ